jgi:hypothetical protein
MDDHEYFTLKAFSSPASHMISAVDLSSKTLLYGYTTDRLTQHTFQHKGQIYSIKFDETQTVVSKEVGFELDFEKVIPDKRLYPERCDFMFCHQLLQRGAHLPFTSFNPEAEPATLICGFTDIQELDQPASAFKR